MFQKSTLGSWKGKVKLSMLQSLQEPTMAKNDTIFENFDKFFIRSFSMIFLSFYVNVPFLPVYAKMLFLTI